MELEFDVTQSFSDDISHLPEETRAHIVDQINVVAASLLNGKKEFNESATIPYLFTLKNGYESSMYLLKVDSDNRIVAAVDEDPIFDTVSLLLFRLVDKSIAEETYKEVGETIYKQYGML